MLVVQHLLLVVGGYFLHLAVHEDASGGAIVNTLCRPRHPFDICSGPLPDLERKGIRRLRGVRDDKK
jgi:hypothetical protein